VNVPRVAESPVSFEKGLHQARQTALARPIVRAGRRGDYFEIRPDAMFEMRRPD